VELFLTSYGITIRETCFLILREIHRLKVFENRVTGTKRDEVTGEYRRKHNEELNDLYSSPNIIRIIPIKENVMGG
jgi:hypothetical protein